MTFGRQMDSNIEKRVLSLVVVKCEIYGWQERNTRIIVCWRQKGDILLR